MVYSSGKARICNDRSSCHGAAETDPTTNQEVAGSIPGLLSGLRIWRCCEVWCRPTAVPPIRPLAWEPPYIAGAALKNKEKKKKEFVMTKGCQWTLAEPGAGPVATPSFTP